MADSTERAEEVVVESVLDNVVRVVSSIGWNMIRATKEPVKMYQVRFYIRTVTSFTIVRRNGISPLVLECANP